jgi:hypothetical protein
LVKVVVVVVVVGVVLLMLLLLLLLRVVMVGGLVLTLLLLPLLLLSLLISTSLPPVTDSTFHRTFPTCRFTFFSVPFARVFRGVLWIPAPTPCFPTVPIAHLRPGVEGVEGVMGKRLNFRADLGVPCRNSRVNFLTNPVRSGVNAEKQMIA